MAEEKVSELRDEIIGIIVTNSIGGTDDFPAVSLAGIIGDLEEFLSDRRTPTPVTEDVVLLNDLFDFLGGVDGAAELRSRIIAALSASTSPPKAVATDDAADALWEQLLPLMQSGAPDVYQRKVDALAAIRSALVSPSIKREA